MGLNGYKNKIVRFLLVCMIALSIFLSWLIWTQSSRSSIDEIDSSISANIQEIDEKEVFIPVKVFQHTKKSDVLYTNRESIMGNLVQELIKLDFTTIKKLTLTDKEGYLEYLNKENTVELVFSNQLSLTYFLKIYGFDIENKEKDGTFNRILVDVNTNKLFFLNDDTFEVTALHFSGSLVGFNELMNDSDNNYMSVELIDKLPKTLLYGYKEPVHLQKYSYILETQSYTVFSDIFFSATQDIISQNTESKNLKLITLDGQSLTVANKTGVVTFEDTSLNSNIVVDQERPTIFEQTFAYMKKIGKTIGRVRYFDQTASTVTYKQFVEGYPIFGEYGRGEISITNLENKKSIVLNQNTIQVPIPSNEEIVLPKTFDVLEKLKGAGIDKNKIQNLQIGYTWTMTNEGKNIVALQPEWYVKVGNKWRTVEELVALSREERGSE